MTIYEIITLFALIIGPISAVQIDRILSKVRDAKNRKLDIFKTLMATRGSILSYRHVEALNRIDLEFQGKNYSKVINAWKEYFDDLCQPKTEESGQAILERRQNFLSSLLLEMGKSLGYNFDRVLIKRNIYSPVGHQEIERQEEFIRKGMISILEGDLTLPISIESIELNEEAEKRQKLMQELLIEYYTRENKKLSAFDKEDK
jgi:hypothetical protein